jgi:multicomponent Na+:H+ antiporter subunit B
MDIGILLSVLAFFMVIAALIAVETSNLLSSIISMGALGFLLSIGYLLLGAPEIAITQIVVEIIVLVILIRATINRDLTAISGDREFIGLIFTVAIIFVFSLVGLRVFGQLPLIGSSVLDRIPESTSMTYLLEGLKRTGSFNTIESIMLDFRAYDSLGIMTVLFAAILGALALLRRRSRKSIETTDTDIDSYEITTAPEGMSLIVKTVTRWIKGFLLLFGIYLMLYGHESPGGGVTGGVIIACTFILITLAEGQKRIGSRHKITATVLASLAALFVLAMAAFGQTHFGLLFKNFIAFNQAKYPAVFTIGSMQLTEIGIGILVSAGLFLVFSMFSTVHVRVKDGKREMINRRRH